MIPKEKLLKLWESMPEASQDEVGLVFLINNWKFLPIHARVQIWLLTWRNISRRKRRARKISEGGFKFNP